MTFEIDEVVSDIISQLEEVVANENSTPVIKIEDIFSENSIVKLKEEVNTENQTQINLIEDEVQIVNKRPRAEVCPELRCTHILRNNQKCSFKCKGDGRFCSRHSKKKKITYQDMSTNTVQFTYQDIDAIKQSIFTLEDKVFLMKNYLQEIERTVFRLTNN